MNFIRTPLLVLSLILVAGCAGKLGRRSNAPKADFSVTAEQSTVHIGQTLKATAVLDGKDISDRVVWGVSDESILEIEPGGYFRALSAGSVTVVANISKFSAHLGVEVPGTPPAAAPEDQPPAIKTDQAGSITAAVPELSITGIDREAGTFQLVVTAADPEDLIAVSETTGTETNWLTPAGPGDNSKAFFPAKNFPPTGILLRPADQTLTRTYTAIAKVKNGNESAPSPDLEWSGRPVPAVTAAVNEYITSLKVKLSGDPQATYAVSVSDGTEKTWLGPDGNLFHTTPQWAALEAFGGDNGITAATTTGKSYTIAVRSYLPRSFYSDEIPADAVDANIYNPPPEVTDVAISWNGATNTILITWESGGGSTAGYYVRYKRSASSSPESGPLSCSGTGAEDWTSWGSVRSYSKVIAVADLTKFSNFQICSYDNGNPRRISYGVVASYKPSTAEQSLGTPASFVAEEAGSQYGFSVGSGSHSNVSQTRINIAVGAPASDLDSAGGSPLTDAGKAHFYHYNNSTGAIVTEQQLIAEGTNARHAGDRYGHAVTIGTKYLAVGAPMHDFDSDGANPVDDAGAVFVYEHSSGTDSWNLIRKYVSPARQAGGYFGQVLHMYDNTENTDTWLILVGAPGEGPGQVYIYGDTGGAGLPLESAGPHSMISGEHNGDRFGSDIRMPVPESLFIGAPFHRFDAGATNELSGAGAVYAFNDFKRNLDYNLFQKLTPTVAGTRHAGDRFGFSVSYQLGSGAGGASLIIGAPYRDLDENGEYPVTDAGMVFGFGSASTVNGLSIASCTGNDAVLDGTPDLSSILSGNTFVDETGNMFRISAVTGNTISLTSGPCTTDGSDDAQIIKPYTHLNSWHQGMITGNEQRTAGALFGYALAGSISGLTIGVPGYPLDSSGKAPLRNAGAAYRKFDGGVTFFTGKDRRTDGLFGSALAVTGLGTRQMIGQPGLTTSTEPARVELTTCGVITAAHATFPFWLALIFGLPVLLAAACNSRELKK